MKVCSDACLFGAWVAAWAAGGDRQINNILDIGTGTGLLSLMLAQKTTAFIDAVEINSSAAAQARENIAASDWKKRINVFETAVQHFRSTEKYDLIISNPPFFQNDLASPAEDKNMAKHSSSLSLDELFQNIHGHLSGKGFAALLLPYHRREEAKKIAAKYQLHLLNEISVKQSSLHSYFRSILLFSNQPETFQPGEILIRDSYNEYPEAFKALLKDYYLYL